MCKTHIMFQQHARRILAHHSNRKRCLFHSYATVSSSNADQTLPSRIDVDHNAHITLVLESLRKQVMKPSDLRGLIKNLCDSNQFSKALEASEWMGEQRFTIFPEDYAARLHLVENVLGLEEAEKFFIKSIPENMKDHSVYATLLSAYTKSVNTVDKAEATFDKMRELGFHLKLSSFNSMISLYGQLGKQDMVEKLVQEIMQESKLEECDVSPKMMNNILRVYADHIDHQDKMETFKTWVVDEQGIKFEGDTFVSMATAYVRSNSIKKAVEMYGNVPGSETEVHRLWNEYNNKKEEAIKVEDDLYREVISSLLKLDDVQGAEKIYGEWKPEEPEKMDIRIPGLLISRYYAEGNGLKIEQMVNSIRKKRYGILLKKLKECLKFLGGIVVALVLIALMLAGLVSHAIFYERILEEHPPRSYWELQMLKDNPMLYYFLYVRR